MVVKNIRKISFGDPVPAIGRPVLYSEPGAHPRCVGRVLQVAGSTSWIFIRYDGAAAWVARNDPMAAVLFSHSQRPFNIPVTEPDVRFLDCLFPEGDV